MAHANHLIDTACMLACIGIYITHKLLCITCVHIVWALDR